MLYRHGLIDHHNRFIFCRAPILSFQDAPVEAVFHAGRSSNQELMLRQTPKRLDQPNQMVLRRVDKTVSQASPCDAPDRRLGMIGSMAAHDVLEHQASPLNALECSS